MSTASTSGYDPKLEHIAHIRTIRDCLDRGTLLILVGAGVSANSGLPTWYSLINTLAIELGIPKTDYSVDDFQQIPEKFYLTKGETEYHALIKRVLDVTASPNPIHSRILDLNPQHIVTTNYDSLIEQALNSRLDGKEYSLIRSDDEVPKTHSARFYIKMHGDLSLGNYVLKESDYLNYDKNFAGISNIIHGLLTTNLVLLVGFSGNDPNFKLISAKIQQIYGNALKQVFLLHCGSPHSDIDKEYFKSRNITPIYYDVLKEDIERFCIDNDSGVSGSLADDGLKLHNMLYYIQRYHETVSSSLDVVDLIHKKVQSYSSLYLLTPEIITSAIQIHERDCSNIYNELIIHEQGHLTSLHDLSTFSGVKVLTDKDRRHLREVITILGRSWIAWVRLTSTKPRQHVIKPTFDRQWDLKVRQIESYDHFELDREISAESESDATIDSARSKLEWGFLLMKVGEPVRAFKVLGEAIQLAQRHADAWTAFAATYNRDYISRFLYRNMFYYQGASYEEVQAIRDEVTNHPAKKIIDGVRDQNLQDVMRRIDDGRLIYEALSELGDVVKEAFEYVDAVKSGGFSIFDPPLRGRASYHLNKIWNFGMHNCILIQNDSRMIDAIRRYVTVMLCEIKVGVQNYHDDSFDSKAGGREWFSYDLAHFMSCGFNHGELYSLFERIELVDIVITEDVAELMIEAFERLVIFGCQINWRARLYFFEIYFANWLEIFSHCILNSEHGLRLIRAISKYVFEKPISKEITSSLANFLESLERRHCTFESAALEELQWVILRRILQVESIILDLDASRRITESLSRLHMNEVGPKGSVDELVNEVVGKWKNYSLPRVSPILLHAFFPALPFLSQQTKDAVGQFVSKVVGNNSSDNTLFAIFKAIELGLLSPDESVASSFVNGVLSLVEQEPASERSRRRHEKSVDQVVGLLGLMILQRIINPEHFESELATIKEGNPFISLVLHPHEFNFELFGLSWLNYMTPEFQQQVIAIPAARKALAQGAQHYISIGRSDLKVVKRALELLGMF